MESAKDSLYEKIKKELGSHNGEISQSAGEIAVKLASVHNWSSVEFVDKWIDFNNTFVSQYIEKPNYNFSSHRIKFFMTWLDLNDEDREYLTIDVEKWQKEEISNHHNNDDIITKDEHINPEDNILKLYGYKKAISTNIEVGGEAVDNSLDSNNLIDNNVHSSNTNLNGEIIVGKFGKSIDDWNNKFIYEIIVKISDDPHISFNEAFMYDNLASLNGILNNQNSKICKRLIEMWLKDNDKILISYRVTEKILDNFRTWGRICCDDEGKLNNVSAVLSGSDNNKYISFDNDKNSSSEDSDSDSEYEDANDENEQVNIDPNINLNNRNKCYNHKDVIPLDLSNISSYSIFPGQIIGVEGKNPTKSSFIPTKIIPGVLLSDNLTTPNLNNPLNIIIAAGPFSNCLETFYKLMAKVEQNEPNLLILIGPFFSILSTVESEKLGNQTYQERFEYFIDKIMKYVEGKCTKVVLVSSYQEIHHIGVYPTPEYSIRKSIKKPNLFMMPDPCMLDIDGLFIGITSVDVIRHLSTSEYSFNMPQDRLARLANHLLLQSSFYPLVPCSSELPLDRIAWDKYCHMHRQPHILILPSDVRYFYKWNNKTLCLNPSKINKGTFSQLNIEISDNQWSEKCINGEIIKI